MSTHTPRGRSRAPSWKGRLAVAIAAVLLGVGVAAAATLEDFGFNAKRATNRPLLLVLVSYAGQPAFPHPDDVYDSFVFNFLRRPSANGYFLNNSNGRFLWTRALRGTIHLRMSQADASILLEKKLAKIRETALVSGFDATSFDANGDGSVTTDELAFLVIENIDGAGAATRLTPDPRCVKPANMSVTVCSDVSVVGQRVSFMDIVHEMTHLLGALDVYGPGCQSRNLTLMSCTGTGGLGDPVGDERAFHLDPWHKMQLGWTEPRVHELSRTSVVTLPDASGGRADAPIILFDPARGPSEYFLLEYRAATSSISGFYDRSVQGTGLAIWHIRQDASKNPILIEGFAPAMFHEGSPTLARGDNQLWQGNQTTPVLRWVDTTSTGTCIHVRPFKPGASSIDIQWITAPPDGACEPRGTTVSPEPPLSGCGMLRKMLLAQTQIVALLRKQLQQARTDAEREAIERELDIEILQLQGVHEDLRAQGCTGGDRDRGGGRR